MKPLAGVFALFFLGACANRGVTLSKDHSQATAVSESGPNTRGRAVRYRPPVTVENAQALNEGTFRELRAQFLTPIESGPWRYVLDGITLDGATDVEGEWTLLMALDTGARIKLENFGAFDERTGTHFKDGYRRATQALGAVRSQDPALDRYLRYWSPKRQAARAKAAASGLSTGAAVDAG